MHGQQNINFSPWCDTLRNWSRHGYSHIRVLSGVCVATISLATGPFPFLPPAYVKCIRRPVESHPESGQARTPNGEK